MNPKVYNRKVDSLPCFAKELVDPNRNEIQVILNRKILPPAFNQEVNSEQKECLIVEG